MSTPPEHRKIDEELVQDPPREGSGASGGQNFEEAKKLADKESDALERKAALKVNWRSDGDDLFDVVDEDVIAEVLANWTGIPVYKLTEEETAQPPAHGGGAAQAGRRPGGRDQRALPGDPPHPCRPQGPQAPERARSSSSARPASARPSSPRRSPSCSSATRTR